MTHQPDFDELVGADIGAAERARLRRAHDLLIAAGPPPELSPEIEFGPTLAMSLPLRRSRGRRRMLLLAATLAVLGLVFLGGYIVGNGGGNGLAAGRTLKLSGTSAAPAALASLRIEPVDGAGNWPMLLAVTGLDKLPPKGYYMVYLMRDGKPFAPCGTFVVAGKDTGASIWLNAPYKLQPNDRWVVTKQMPGHHEPGPIVLS